MADLIIHEGSQRLIDVYVEHPFHALLLTGQKGVGLRTIAGTIADTLTSPAHVSLISPESGTISIDVVRQLYSLTRTKQSDRQVVIIDDADAMGIDAQNTLLKLLEEPSENVFFILTTHAAQSMLETILSRVERIEIKPTPRESETILSSLTSMDDTKKRQIAFIAAGLPAEIRRLVDNEEYFQRQSGLATDARLFLVGIKLDMLSTVSKYTAKDAAAELLMMIGKFSVHTLYRSADQSVARRLHLLDETMGRIDANGNVKLQLSRLVMKW